MPLFKALKALTCKDEEYAPGEIMPDAASFPNWRELLEWRYIGYATEDEIADYNAKLAEQKAAEEAAKKAAQEKADTDAKAATEQKAAEEAAKTKK